MDKTETNFLDIQGFHPLASFLYIDYIFFIYILDKEKLEKFFKGFNNYHPNIRFTHKLNKESIPFWDLRGACLEANLLQTCTLRLKANTTICTIHLLIQTIPNVPLFLVKLLRVNRISFNKTDFERHLDDIKS